MDNAVGRGLLNGWQLSGHLVDGERHPDSARLQRPAAAAAASSAAYFGTADVVGPSNSGGNGLAPV